MSGHRITHHHDGDLIVSVIVCDEPDGTFCRLLDEHCDVWRECIDTPTCQVVCPHDPNMPHKCEHPDGLHCTEGHLLRPLNYCQVIDNINMEDGVAAAYGGPEGVPVHDGPIRVWYQDGQWWEYADAEPPADGHCRHCRDGCEGDTDKLTYHESSLGKDGKHALWDDGSCPACAQIEAVASWLTASSKIAAGGNDAKLYSWLAEELLRGRIV